MIKHLATIHDELNKKLKDNDESLSDYELPLQFEDEDPETQIARTIKAARTDPEDILMLKKDKNLILPADFDLTSTSQEKRNDSSSGQDGMQKTGDISVDDVEDLLSPPPQEEDAKSPNQNGDSDTTVDFYA